MSAALNCLERPAIIMDSGTGSTKLGFAGNSEPTLVVPTVVGTRLRPDGLACLRDANICIGEAALDSAEQLSLTYPVHHGLVDDWDKMEQYWVACILQKLRVDSEDHLVAFAEPPCNTLHNREATTEIMFETFGVPGLYMGLQASLALYSSFAAGQQSGQNQAQLTGTVIDSGDGVTNIIPVVDGCALTSCIRSIPIAGRDITLFVQQSLREHGGRFPLYTSFEVARQVKEKYCYVASDAEKERQKFEKDPRNLLKDYLAGQPKTASRTICTVQDEQFLAPELFFNPKLASDFSQPLPQVVDEAIQSCPIDTRRALYGNIVLSGGSTMFKNFGRRIQRDMNRILVERLPQAQLRPEVCVRTHSMQRYAAWSGASLLASVPEFAQMCCSKAEYEENGPLICRRQRLCWI